MGDKKLAAVGLRAGISHGKNTRFIMAQLLDKFILKFITWPAASVTRGTAALNHKIGDNPVKLQIIIISATHQVNKIPYGNWCLFGKKPQTDSSLFSFNNCH